MRGVRDCPQLTTSRFLCFSHILRKIAGRIAEIALRVRGGSVGTPSGAFSLRSRGLVKSVRRARHDAPFIPHMALGASQQSLRDGRLFALPHLDPEDGEVHMDHPIGDQKRTRRQVAAVADRACPAA